MKRKIGEIYNIPIIIGDKNLKTKNEIHIDELSNVPTSGEGGGSASSMEYIDMTSVDDMNKLPLEMFSFAVKGIAGGGKGVFTAMIYSALHGESKDITAVAINLSFRNIAMGMDETIEQSLIGAGIDVASLPRITKEEFYNLDNGESSISFTIDGTSFTAEEGMTWLDFVNSEYSNDDFYVNTDDGNTIVRYQGNKFKDSANSWQKPLSVIVANEAYHTIQEE